MVPMFTLALIGSLLQCTLGAPASAPAARALASPTVVISSPQATIIGQSAAIEIFPGIPFAQPPVGALRLKPPLAITEPFTYVASGNGLACPQLFFSDTVEGAIPTAALGVLLDTPLFQVALESGEDCLNINVHRPVGTTAADSYPVLFWIFGGGFELGYNSMYDPAPWVEASVAAGTPLVVVTVNYRVGGFGFLPGAEILADGSANLGLLDQRLGLQWVADNIADFGGDPTKVTLWGESAGAISIFDQMALYDGDYSYNGAPLFRAAIMNSGSIVPADVVDGVKPQGVYDTVVKSAGCSSATDTLECLREVPYETLLNATNSVAGVLSYSSVALNYLPRPDGTVLTKSPEVLLSEGKYAPVPFIIGDQEDEGTLFALFQSNITTNAELVNYLATVFFWDSTPAQMQALVDTYPVIPLLETYGSPFRSGALNDWYPVFKQLAAILGDLVFTLTRRAFIQTAATLNPDVPSWSYMSSYDYGTPIMGTFHGSDILQVFFGVYDDFAAKAFKAYYINFIYNLDPNVGQTGYANWPQYSDAKQQLQMYPLTSNLVTDDYRTESYDFITENIAIFHI